MGIKDYSTHEMFVRWKFLWLDEGGELRGTNNRTLAEKAARSFNGLVYDVAEGHIMAQGTPEEPEHYEPAFVVQELPDYEATEGKELP